MAIDKVTFNEALNNKVKAAEIANDNLSPEQKGQLINRWGAELWNKWTSVDTNQYELDDTEVSAARTKGKNNAQEKTDGFDGETDGKGSAVGTGASALGALGGGVAGVMTSLIAWTGKAQGAAKFFGWLAVATGAALLSIATLLKTLKPNQEPAQACEDLQTVMSDANDRLKEEQEVLEEGNDKFIKYSADLEEAYKSTDEAKNAEEEEIKMLEQEYNRLVAKAQAAQQGGEPLTEDEKAQLDFIPTRIDFLNGRIAEITTATNKRIDEREAKVEDQTEIMDNSAEAMEEIRGETQFSAEFDEDTVDNAEMVSTAADIGMIGSAANVVAGITIMLKPDLFFKKIINMILGGIAVATSTAAGFLFMGVKQEQKEFAATAEAEVNARQATEANTDEFDDFYQNSLEDFGNAVDINKEKNPFEYNPTNVVPASIPTESANNENTSTQTIQPAPQTKQQPVTESEKVADEKSDKYKKDEI